ncbi:MAG: 3-phosphoglycerate dehydrogenase [Clostridia bacterium]|nr:3-phosphoglycerate dehydrogenase [Clostridia bacterium]
MKNIKLMNKIAACGTDIFDRAEYSVSEDCQAPEAIMVRSAALHDMAFNPELLAIARCGAGVNNIPIDRCTEAGIVVFNTPGANANGVKELVICALMLASRDVIGGANWAETLTSDVAKSVEKGKSAFAGCELRGKTLGVIGLGAIGAMVANAALDLGMKVIGYDPYLTVDGAWRISRAVGHAVTTDEIFEKSDYITLHVPAVDATRGMIRKENIDKMKDGVKIINLARADLAIASDIKDAIAAGKISAYVTDFPTEETLGVKGIVNIPHLGASTGESEDNCAIMAANQLVEFLTTGNIRNSVNFPAIDLPAHDGRNVLVLHANIPATIAKIAGAVAERGVNIEHLSNKSRGNNACSLLALAAGTSDEDIEWIKRTISEFEGMWRVIVI